MQNCSDEFPKTEDLYPYISEDVLSIVMLTVSCLLAVVCILIFLEEIVYLLRRYQRDDVKFRRLATILGLYPVTSITSLICLLVPRSTILLDLISSCYISICFYTFVTLTIDYFGGKKKMLEVILEQKVQLNTPPCCCCCCCVLKPITMTRKALTILKFCSLQVTLVQPLLAFITAVLWADGKLSGKITASSSFLYITVLTTISTLVSLYGFIVIYRASRDHLKMYLLWLKYGSFYTLFVLGNLQKLVIGILAAFDLPPCIGTRGTKVRGDGLYHSLLVIETFLLALLARKAYRRNETEIEGPTSSTDAGFSPLDVENLQQKDGDSGFANKGSKHQQYGSNEANACDIFKSGNAENDFGADNRQSEDTLQTGFGTEQIL